jgi:prevent-host-death family protein
MESVSVAELKAKLSHYLREVREGASFTVVSRDIPVAILAPYEPDDIDDLEIIAPTEDPALWGQVDLPPLALSRDIVDYLSEVRQDREFGQVGPASRSAHPRGIRSGAQSPGTGSDTGEGDE